MDHPCAYNTETNNKLIRLFLSINLEELAE